MRSLLHRLADNNNPDSWSGRLRQARFALFSRLILAQGRPLRVLDIGGDPYYWQQMSVLTPLPIEVFLLNLRPYEVGDGMVSLVGDGRSMPEFEENAFDVVHCNSVIEHIGSLSEQRQMATEIQRVGRAYFVQTPNRYFPLEPHVLIPFFQFLPRSWRLFIACRWRPGWYRHWPEAEMVADIQRIRLLKRSELGMLFPNGRLWEERLWGLTKSFVVYAGFDD